MQPFIHRYDHHQAFEVSKRLSVHLQEGNFICHYSQNHGILWRQVLLQNTSIIDRDQDRRRLRMREALHIMKLKLTLNITQETLLLPTNVRRTCPPRNEEIIPVRTPASTATNQNSGVPVEAAENPCQTRPPQNQEVIPAGIPTTTTANPSATENSGIRIAADNSANPPPEPHHPAPVRRSARLRHIAPTYQPMKCRSHVNPYPLCPLRNI